MTTITVGASTITPTHVLGYEAHRERRTVRHELTDGSVTYSLLAAGPRTGTLEMLFTSASSAKTAFDLHATGGTFVLADATVTQINMTYVVTGRIALKLTSTRNTWIVTADYSEVP